MKKTETPATVPGRRQLPKLEDLHHDIQTAFKTDELNMLLNQPAHESWIKMHPMAKTKNNQGQDVAAKYMPIDKVEFMLTYIFGEWRLEIMNISLLLNTVVATVRLHYRLPTTGEWSFHDGVGGKDVQLKRGAAASDLTQLTHAGVMMAAPSAVSYALKDAAGHLGTLFGRDLNRRDVIEFTGAYGSGENTETETAQVVAMPTPINMPPPPIHMAPPPAYNPPPAPPTTGQILEFQL